jgi:hypothetical protein
VLTRSPRKLFAWRQAVRGNNDNRWHERSLLVEASLAMGSGSTEEQLLRLMVWVGARLHHCWRHSGLRDPLDILKEGTAWCDQYVKVFNWLVGRLLGLGTRALSLRHAATNDGHYVSEVRYDGVWHLFDVHPDHQIVYRDPRTGVVLSWEGVAANRWLVRDEDSWYKGKVGFYYTTPRYEDENLYP